MRLCEGSDIPVKASYATLSHCWGSSMPIKMTIQNINDLKSPTPVERLGQTFRDAIKTALELGLEYIWIDSLCIIQDSTEDWHRESVKMSLVYGNSMCNIAATTASDNDAGCFRPHNENTLEPVKITFEKSSVYLTDTQHWAQRFQAELLNQRAWVVQERLLSPRNIHYDRDQLVWECNELFASERFPKGFGGLINKTAKPLRISLDTARLNGQEEAILGQSLRQVWRPAVNKFAFTNITKPTDRHIAIHGIGSRIRDICGWPYVAGMFLKNLQSQLCWATIGDCKSLRPECAIAPSWSWVSVNQPVEMMPQWYLVENDKTGDGPRPEDLKEQYLCRVTDVESGSSAEESTGHVSTAKLHVSCYMVPAVFIDPEDVHQDRLSEHTLRLDEHRIVNEYRFRTRPMWADFDFIRDNPAVADRRSRGDTSLGDGAVKISWDFWAELQPSKVHDLWFMPVYKVQEYDGWGPAAGYHKFYTIHGLLLQANKTANGRRSFRRCGIFTINDGWKEFWERAQSFPPIEGVDLVPTDGVPVPAKVDPSAYWRTRHRNKRAFFEEDGVLQYQVTIV
ncbi:hypothetical protein OPT61_g5361 [Boeremia exigua]|uniref:Uncharacterized protein n=1 Tax=Boeremia exigua TaxID=749465 RepID=A0ACC2IAQ8_9PLEO|nr:hypothetical protein OPT61_g5361 [Boeremia exigua]